MKRSKTLFVIISLLAFLINGCVNKGTLDIAGEYKFDGIIYLSMLSSATKDFREGKSKGDTYHISSDGIIIESVNNPYEYSNVVFQKEKLEIDYIKVFGNIDPLSIEDYQEKYQYNIYDNENKLLNIRFYLLDGELWFSHFVNNTADKSEIIFDILKLTKLK